MTKLALILFPALLLAQRVPRPHVGIPQRIEIGSQPDIWYAAGDSITVGYGAKAGYPALVSTIVPLSIYNAGINGQRMSQIAATGAYVDTLLAPWATVNIESTLACTNDLLNGISPEQCYEETKAWHLARRAAGWKTIDFTLPSLNGAAFYAGTNGEALREELNALKVADHDYADVLVRVDLDPNLGCHNCFTLSVAFQSDGIHPSDFGQAILAKLATDALNAILDSTATTQLVLR